MSTSMFNWIRLVRRQQWWLKRHPLSSVAAHNKRIKWSYNEYEWYAMALVYIDYYMLFSYGYCGWQNWGWETKHLIRWPFWLPWRCAGVIRSALLDVQCSMPRATPKAIGCRHQVTTHSILPWWPPGGQSTKRRCKIPPLCWPFRWSCQ